MLKRHIISRDIREFLDAHITSVAMLEALLLIGGVFLYWRAANRNNTPSTSRVTPAVVSGALLVSGVVVLVLDALGI